MRARQMLIGLATALAIGLATLQPAPDAAAEEKKQPKGCCIRDFDSGVPIW